MSRFIEQHHNKNILDQSKGIIPSHFRKWIDSGIKSWSKLNWNYRKIFSYYQHKIQTRCQKHKSEDAMNAK